MHLIFSKPTARAHSVSELGRYRPGGLTFKRGPASAPLASLCHGAAGIGYCLYRIGQRRRDGSALALADLWTQKAFAFSSRVDAFRVLRPDRASLFCSDPGLHFLRSLVSAELRDVQIANAAIRRFLTCSRRKSDSIDLIFGKPGLLLGCAEIIEAITTKGQHDVQAVRSRGDEIASEMITAVQHGKFSSSRSSNPITVAHGLGGLLFALLRWAGVVRFKKSSTVFDILDELASLSEPCGGYLQWPLHTQNPYLKHSWCSGTAGLVLLFALGHEISGRSSYGEASERTALTIPFKELPGGSLCCGLGGIAYAFLAVHRFTGSKTWLNRAREAARRAVAMSRERAFQDSLYNGLLGALFVLEDLEQPKTAGMPIFEPLRATSNPR